MEHIVFDMVVLDVIHQMCSIAFHLLRGSNGTEYDFSEALSGKHSKTDTTDRPAIFDQRQSTVLTANIKKNNNFVIKCSKRITIM